MDLKTNPYSELQRNFYNNTADRMNEQNHLFHNQNKDYWLILLGMIDESYKTKIGLDFGCGCGRNIMNNWERFKRLDGVDISVENIKRAEQNILKNGCPKEKFNLYVNNGYDLSELQANEYDIVFSTIALQHIPVHTIRYNLLSEFYRILKDGGIISIQMGYGQGHQNAANYFEDIWHAKGTNSIHDVRIDSPDQVETDLEKIGFKNIQYRLRPSYSDSHCQWIFFTAMK